MTRDETARIMLMLMSALRLTRPIPDNELLLDGWYLALFDLDYPDAQAAAATILREEQYFPEPSKVRRMVLQARTNLPDADMAWSIIVDRLKGRPWPFGPEESPTVISAINEAVKGLGGLSALRASERPERDRDAFLRLWPDIAARHFRNPKLSAPTPAVSLSEPEDRGFGHVDYERQQPVAVPASIVRRSS